MNRSFWNGRRVLLTGHTGFKGAWLSLWLEQLGAEVTGLAHAPNTSPALFDLLAPWPQLESTIGDVAHQATVSAAVARTEAEIVFHLAAQPLVRRSYADPVETFATNTMGTVHVLDAVRSSQSVRAVVVVTSDKVYQQGTTTEPFTEQDRLGGSDPYSASKAVQELVTASFAASYFTDPLSARLATCRAGNVIGGGDWAADRLIPDFFRAIAAGEALELRHPGATRPWQHVLEPLRGYLTFAERLHAGDDLPGALNFGPDETALTVADVISRLAAIYGSDQTWNLENATAWPEHHELQLDSSAADKALDWRPALNIGQALDLTASWYRAHAGGHDMRDFSIRQIEAYMETAA